MRTQGDYNHQSDGEWKLTTITMMLVLVVVLVLTVRGAAAFVRCLQSCFGRREEGVDTRRCQQEPLLSVTPTGPTPQQKRQPAACGCGLRVFAGRPPGSDGGTIVCRFGAVADAATAASGAGWLRRDRAPEDHGHDNSGLEVPCHNVQRGGPREAPHHQDPTLHPVLEVRGCLEGFPSAWIARTSTVESKLRLRHRLLWQLSACATVTCSLQRLSALSDCANFVRV